METPKSLPFIFFTAPSKPKDDWSAAPGANNSGWGEPRRDGPGGAIGTRNGTDVNPVGRTDQGSWNTPAPIRPSGSGPSGNQWNSGIPPPSRGAGGWDHDSPPISRRDDGTSYWGREKPPGAPGAPPVGGGMGGKKNLCSYIVMVWLSTYSYIIAKEFI